MLGPPWEKNETWNSIKGQDSNSQVESESDLFPARVRGWTESTVRQRAPCAWTVQVYLHTCNGWTFMGRGHALTHCLRHATVEPWPGNQVELPKEVTR